MDFNQHIKLLILNAFQVSVNLILTLIAIMVLTTEKLFEINILLLIKMLLLVLTRGRTRIPKQFFNRT